MFRPCIIYIVIFWLYLVQEVNIIVSELNYDVIRLCSILFLLLHKSLLKYLYIYTQEEQVYVVDWVSM